MKLFRYFAAVVVLAVAVCCEEPLEIKGSSSGEDVQQTFVRAAVTKVGLTGFEVSISASEATPYYVVNYKADEFEGVTMESVAASLRKKVSLGASWSSFLRVGDQTVSFSSLYTDTDYKVLVFGINADGQTTTQPVVLDVTTEVFSAQTRLIEASPFEYSIEVTPNRDDIGWYGVTFFGNESALINVSDETLLTYIRYYIGQDSASGSTVSEITQKGTAVHEGECNPDDHLLFTVVAVDENFRVVSDVTRLLFKPDMSDILILGEQRTEHIHSFIYAYNHEEMGVFLEFTGYDPEYPGYPGNTLSFNGDSKAYYGVDMYRADAKTCAEALAANMTREFNYYRTSPQYKPYFDACSTPEECMDLIWYDTKAYEENGKIWERISYDELMTLTYGEDPDEIAFAISINGIDSDYKIYPMEYCVSRAKFSELGYAFKK